MDMIVVGVGWAGQRHVRAIQWLAGHGEDVGAAALVDTDCEHLFAQSSELGVGAAYTDLEEALAAHPEAKGVVLATPHHLHRQGTEAAARAGRHVLVEKPMALTLEDADAMVRACDDAGVTLMVAESARYSREAASLREVVASGRIGQILSGHIDLIPRGHKTFAYPGRRAWLADPAVCGGGMWMLNGVHQMSLARMLLGEVTRIYAREVRSDAFESPVEATITAMVEFESSAAVSMTVSAELHGYKRFNEVVLFGSEGTLRLDRGKDAGLTVYAEAADGVPEQVDCSEDDRGGAPAAFVRQMREFISAVREDRPPATSGRCERATLSAILAGYESARTHRPVVPEPAKNA